MKTLMRAAAFALAALSAAALFAGCGKRNEQQAEADGPVTILRTEAAGSPAPGQTEAPGQTDAPENTEAPDVTFAPENTEPPADLPELTDEDRELIVLVNFEHPIYSEPPVEFITENLTASNVVCDPRRHADARAISALDDMLNAAASDGEYHFIIASAFRSISEQEILWNGRSNQDPAYGSDPHNAPVSVMPKNCSEHTTGLAFDILCDNCPHSDPTFAYTAEGRWLMENAWRFGFVLRYPADKQNVTGVQYEPWHYRYVGSTAAAYMRGHGLCLEELAELINGN